MKKTISILLLCSFALYHFGYYGLYFSFSAHLESEWSDRIFQDGDLEEFLMEIPLAVPYLADQEGFQAVNTSFEKDGRYFRAIKQRYLNDTLQVVYVADSAKGSLSQVVSQWVRSLVQDDVPDQGSNSLLGKIYFKDYSKPDNPFAFQTAPILGKQYIGFIFSPFVNFVSTIESPPPQVL